MWSPIHVLILTRGSSGPELPLALDDDEEPPGLDDDASTIDYRDQEEAESDEELDSEGDLKLDHDASENSSLTYLFRD